MRSEKEIESDTESQVIDSGLKRVPLYIGRHQPGIGALYLLK